MRRFKAPLLLVNGGVRVLGHVDSSGALVQVTSLPGCLSAYFHRDHVVVDMPDSFVGLGGWEDLSGPIPAPPARGAIGGHSLQVERLRKLAAAEAAKPPVEPAVEPAVEEIAAEAVEPVAAVEPEPAAVEVAVEVVPEAVEVEVQKAEEESFDSENPAPDEAPEPEHAPEKKKSSRNKSKRR